MGRRPLPKRITPSVIGHLIQMTTWGISSPFELLSPASGQVTNALLTHSPLRVSIATNPSFDLHVLGTPPAFILSQDQTLRKKFYTSFDVIASNSSYSPERQCITSYHYSVVKVLLIERAVFYHRPTLLSRLPETPNADASLSIGTSDHFFALG